MAYTNGKAAADSFTRWLAVHMAQTYAPRIRVNAVAPGFMITEQNRFLLTDRDTGELTERGETVLSQVPMTRFGAPPAVVGCARWLFSDQASFVTGGIVADHSDEFASGAERGKIMDDVAGAAQHRALAGDPAHRNRCLR